LRRNRPQAASAVFLVGGVIFGLAFYWIGRGVFSAGVVIQLAVVVHAGMLLERNRMLWIALFFMCTDLAKVLLEQRGWTFPLVLPGAPISSWSVMALCMVWVAPAVFCATENLELAVGKLREQVAELREANVLLQRSEELRQSISETAPVGILVFDEHGKNIFANSFAVARLGEEVFGCSWDHLPWPLTDHDGKPFAEGASPLDRVGSGKSAVYGQPAALERPPGRRIYLSLSAAPLGPDNSGVVVAFEDVSHRVEMERRHLHSQRLSSMGQMAGFLAHDFNNFLTVIRGDSKLMLAQTRDDADRIRLARMIRTSDHAAAICRQLLAFSRREQTPAYPLSVSGLIEEHAALLSSVVPDRINVVIDTMPDLPLVQAESSLLLQVLLNLMVNARDAMPEGGRLVVQTTRSSSGDGVMLVVEDSGVGMDEKTLESIFDPYFTTKPAGGGSGMGLAIVYGVVQQLQGWIRVDSHQGQGTRFLIYLPAAPVARTQTAS
jgi:PAS domain S-box-containing protein